MKVELARKLRRETTMTLQWIAEALCMGSWSYISEIAVVSGEKWRVETGNREKVVIAVFDGKSVNTNFPYDNKDALDPGLDLRSLQKDAAHPTSVETVERNGRKFVDSLYCRDVRFWK